MSFETIETIVVAVALIAFITIRQAIWQPVNLTRLGRTPLILGVIGVISLASSVHNFGAGWHIGALDIAVIATELALGLVAGWLMGRMTQIQRFGDVLKSRLAPAGVGVWLGFLAVRIGLGVAAHVFDAQLAEQTGTILIVVAVIKSIQALMIRERIDRHQADERQRAYAETSF